MHQLNIISSFSLEEQLEYLVPQDVYLSVCLAQKMFHFVTFWIVITIFDAEITEDLCFKGFYSDLGVAKNYVVLVIGYGFGVFENRIHFLVPQGKDESFSLFGAIWVEALFCVCCRYFSINCLENEHNVSMIVKIPMEVDFIIGFIAIYHFCFLEFP